MTKTVTVYKKNNSNFIHTEPQYEVAINFPDEILTKVTTEFPIMTNDYSLWEEHGYTSRQHHLSLHPFVLNEIAMNIVRRELKSKELLTDELNKLINSSSDEDFRLAYNIMEKSGCIYSHLILQKIMTDVPPIYEIETYYSRNKKNITDNIL